MFDLGVAGLTANSVGLLLMFIAVGFILRRSGKLPEDAGRVLSLLTTLLFTPAYTIRSLSANFTMTSLGEKAFLLILGTAVVLCAMALAYFAAKVIGTNDFERRSLTYAFSIPNYGYFGYPVVAGVFGSAVKADMIVFCIPISIVTNSIGYLLFSEDRRIRWKSLLLNPMLLGVLIGTVIGLSGLQLPPILDSALSSAADCMSPASMLLAGFVLGRHPVKWLISGWRAYAYTAIRLLVIPALFAPVLMLLGLREMHLLIPLVTLSMPLGLNLVVFPESHGHNADNNAKLCFVSYVMALLLLPVTFTLIQFLCQLP